jgi:hypothetical protein
VVEHLAHNPKIKGLNPNPTAADKKLGLFRFGYLSPCKVYEKRLLNQKNTTEDFLQEHFIIKRHAMFKSSLLLKSYLQRRQTLQVN